VKKKSEYRSGAGSRQSIFIISGPSGSGKTTLLEKLLRDSKIKEILVKSISFTTRAKRSKEKGSRDYFFITEKTFKQKLRAKKILEWTRYLGYYYATPKDFVEKQLKKGKHVVLCLDLKGALKIKRLYPKNAVTIFIVPPSIKALKCRIEGRCNKTKKEEIGKRLKLARQELRGLSKYDYYVVNKSLSKAVGDLQGIILKEIGLTSNSEVPYGLCSVRKTA